MLRILTSKLIFPENERVNSSMGSVFHGALMEKLPQNIQDELHTKNLRPYSQSVFFDKETATPLWRLTFLTEEIYEVMGKVLTSGEKFFLKQKNYTVVLGETQEIKTSFEELSDKAFLAEDSPKGANLRFITPTGFKRGERFVIFPEPYLLFQSLVNRWNAFTDGATLEESNFIDTLAASAEISRYCLHTELFSVEGKFARGFRGEIALNFRGNDMTKRLMYLLANFAPYAGIGVKTALGMGAVEMLN